MNKFNTIMKWKSAVWVCVGSFQSNLYFDNGKNWTFMQKRARAKKWWQQENDKWKYIYRKKNCLSSVKHYGKCYATTEMWHHHTIAILHLYYIIKYCFHMKKDNITKEKGCYTYKRKKKIDGMEKNKCKFVWAHKIRFGIK